MREHVTILGCAYIAFGLLGILGAAVILIVITGGGLLSGDTEAIAITGVVGATIASFVFLLSVPDVIAGIGLLRHRGWSRYMAIVLGVLNLPAIPFGTALGIYTIWALSRPETVALFHSPRPGPTVAAS